LRGRGGGGKVKSSVVGVSAAGLALSRRAVSEEKAGREESSGYVDVPGQLLATELSIVMLPSDAGKWTRRVKPTSRST
jgi:hypothetical protein